jgi:hypothetical protein
VVQDPPQPPTAAPAPQSVSAVHPCPQCGKETARLQELAMDLITPIVDRRLRQIGLLP